MSYDHIISQIKDSISTKEAIINDDKLISKIEEVAQMCIKALKSNKKIIFAGNGGSAADAQHLATELMGRYLLDRSGLASIALTTDTSLLTAIGNDYGFDKVFSRQLDGIGNDGDIFIGISTSGNSKNILNALEKCLEKNISTIGMTSKDGGKMKDKCELCLCVPSNETPRIQESHIMIGHIICFIIETSLFGEHH